MKKTIISLAILAASQNAFAHISYTGRDFGTINGNSVTISNQTVTSNFGWADASDLSLAFDTNYASWHTADSASYSPTSFMDSVDNLYYGDSHKGKAFKFHLDSTQTLSISATANASATASSVGGLAAGFSIYQGLATVAPFTAPQTSADHDFAVASEAWRTSQVQSVTGNNSYNYFATQGSWNALGNWYMGGDGDPSNDLSALDLFQYMGSAYTTAHDGIASGFFTLGPGDYTIFVGGNDLATKNTTDAIKAYGISLNVAAVPEPETYGMLLIGLGILTTQVRRSKRAMQG